MVRNRKNQEVTLLPRLFQAVNDAVREACHYARASLAQYRATGPRMELKHLKTALDSIQEEITKTVGFCIVEGRRLEELQSR